MPILCAITNRQLFASGQDIDVIDEAAKCAKVIEQAALWAANGVDIIQLREKDLPGSVLAGLAKGVRAEILRCHVPERPATRLLINNRPDVAIAANADGVHLPSGADALAPDEVRAIFAAAGCPNPYLSIACHTVREVESARTAMVDLIVFAPVFGKEGIGGQILPGSGVDVLRAVCRAAAPVPVMALGGVTAENAADCLDAGATGIAAIRLFHESPSTWRKLAGSPSYPMH